MNKDKFLTVYAVFDDKTQIKLKEWQDKVLSSGLRGSQTMDIPFHISLGSFPTEQKDALIEQMRNVTKTHLSFAVTLSSVQTFANKVLYIAPDASSDITSLHNMFDCNFADGLEFVPHVTIFIGTECDTSKAKQILTTCFEPLQATVTEIHLSEFFPSNFIACQKLK